MMFKKLSLFTALAAMTMPLGTSALSVLVPSSSWWWQTGDSALLEWDCTDTSHAQFAVVVVSSNVTQLTAGYDVLIGQQNNDQCSTNIIPNLVVGSGYKITLTNIVNYTDVYATSEPFEVKAKGSPYPTGPTPHYGPYSTATSTTGSGNGTTTTRTGGAVAQLGLSLGGALALAGTVVAVLA